MQLSLPTTNSKAKRWGLIAGIVALMLIVFGVAAFFFARKALKDQVVQALGPESEVQAIEFGWSGVEVIGLRIRGPKGWPATDTLRAERIVVLPDLRSLLSKKYRVGSVTIERPYLSALRAKDGRLRVVPSLMERASHTADKKGATSPPIFIGKIKLEEGVFEFFDATVRQPALKVRLEQMQATLDDVEVPTLAGRTQLKLDGILKGIRRDGALSIAGWAEMGSKDSLITTKLRGVDLVSLQPYLIKASETGVQKGQLDLDLKSTVHRNHLQAPGTVNISDLELSNSGGAFGTFMGVPRHAVVAFLKNQNGQISVKFMLDGDLNDPKFSLNENITTRLASSMAESLGVSLKGVASGVGSVSQKGVEAAGSVGKAIGKLFGK